MTGAADTSDDESCHATKWWRRVEIAVAIVITWAAVWLHVVRAGKAGGLWRDEAGAVNLAQLPSLGDLAANLHHEAFPILFSLTVRAFTFVTGGSDTALRLFGLAVGLSFIAALWFAGRALHRRPPLIALGLLGINGSMIHWVDWMRGHGLGVVLILLTLALVWQLTHDAPFWRIAVTAFAAICSVQMLYYNAVLLFAIGLAGAVVCARAGHWKRASAILLIGAVAAASLIPYIPISRRAADSSVIYTLPEFPLSLFWSKLRDGLGGSASGLAWVWLVIAVIAIAAAIWMQLRRSSAHPPRMRDAGLYCLAILLVSVPAYFGFLSALKYQTQPWYYIALIAVAGVAIDGILGSFARAAAARALSIAAAVAIAIASVAPTWAAIQVRQTNVDLAAAKLSESTARDDLIVVMPWYLGVSFGRYYRGAADWTSVPPITDRALQRYDLLKEQMSAADPVAPVMDAMRAALRSGNRVWLVGQLLFPETDEAPAVLPPAPHSTAGWSEGAYQTSWNLQVTHFLQTHVLGAEEIPIGAGQPVNPHENVRIVVVQGWRGAPGN